jgi:hypothetical protein
MNLRRDKQQKVQLKLDFRATPTGEAQQAAQLCDIEQVLKRGPEACGFATGLWAAPNAWPHRVPHRGAIPRGSL